MITPCVCPGVPPKPCLRVSYWEPTLLVNTEARTGIGETAAGGRFHDARVWPFPLRELLGLFSFPCSEQTLSLSQLSPYYLSDTDPLWRLGDGVGPGPRIGVWGFLMPRSGWGAGGADPVTSGLSCYRAIDVANNPAAHVVQHPSGVAATVNNRINLGFPKLTRCLRPGAPPQGWEARAGSRTGHYLWVYWTRKSCCVDPEELFGSLLGGLR